MSLPNIKHEKLRNDRFENRAYLFSMSVNKILARSGKNKSAVQTRDLKAEDYSTTTFGK